MLLLFIFLYFFLYLSLKNITSELQEPNNGEDICKDQTATRTAIMAGLQVSCFVNSIKNHGKNFFLHSQSVSNDKSRICEELFKRDKRRSQKSVYEFKKKKTQLLPRYHGSGLNYEKIKK